MGCPKILILMENLGSEGISHWKVAGPDVREREDRESGEFDLWVGILCLEKALFTALSQSTV